MPLSDCVGEEFGSGTLGEIIVRNARSGAWPYLCGPSSASDLRMDPDLGLWVPPRAVSPNPGNDTLIGPVTLPLNTYTDAFFVDTTHEIVNTSACFPMQAVVSCEITCNIHFPSADTSVKVIPWIGPSDQPTPDVSGLPVYKTLHNLWTDAAAQDDSVTITLCRRVGVPPSASVTLLVRLWLYPQANPGSSVTAPQMKQCADVFFAHGWWLTDGSQPVTDAAPAALGTLAPQKTAYISQAVAQDTGRVDYLFQGTDGTLYLLWYSADSPWSSPLSIGGALASRPSCVTVQQQSADAFWLGTDGNLWHSGSSRDSAWSAPDNLGYGTLGSGPQAVAHYNGNVHVFWRGNLPSLAVWWAELSPGSGWSSSAASLGGSVATGSAPAPCVSAPGTTDVFFQGTDGHLWHVFSNNYGASWSSAQSLGMGTITQPKAVGHQNGVVQVFWQAASGGAIWYAQYNPSTGWVSSPTNLGGSMASGTVPWPVVSAEATTDVFFQGTDGHLWHVFSNNYGASWSSAQSLGMGTITQPHAVGQPSGNIDVFWKGSADAHVHTARYTGATGWTGPTDIGGSAA